MKEHRLSVEYEPILASTERALRSRYGPRLLALTVWRPGADCEPDDGADIQVIAVLQDEFDRDVEISEVSKIASAVGTDFGVFLLIVPVSESEFRSPDTSRRGLEIQQSVRVA